MIRGELPFEDANVNWLVKMILAEEWILISGCHWNA
jgi:hypothetical protein